MSTMVEIKAGPELDAAVAEACGVDGWIESLRNEATGYQSPERFVLKGTVFWEPSTDLNAAFAAAERVGLFVAGNLPDGRSFYRMLLCFEPNLWSIGELHEGHAGGYHEPIASGSVLGADEAPTPALAICAAILALKG